MSHIDYNVILFAHDYVGRKIIEFFLSHNRSDLTAVVLMDKKSDCFNTLMKSGFNKEDIFFKKDIYNSEFVSFLNKHRNAQLILAWWPSIIKEPILTIPQKGIINFHPSYLPYDRGKDPNFWTLVGNTPFGVSLQIIDDSIDGGDVIFQKRINKTWMDTGKSLYEKAREAIINLFIDNYTKIKIGDIKPVRQNQDEGSFHYRKELEPRSEIILNKTYTAKDLINLLRARTFPPNPSCYFYDDNGEKYEIRVEIEKIINDDKPEDSSD